MNPRQTSAIARVAAGLITPGSSIASLNQVDVLVTDAELDNEGRRIVSEQVGQLIEAEPFDGEADTRPKKVRNS